MVGSKWLGLATNKGRRKKLVLMHQASLCEFQQGCKFGIEDKKWR